MVWERTSFLVWDGWVGVVCVEGGWWGEEGCGVREGEGHWWEGGGVGGGEGGGGVERGGCVWGWADRRPSRARLVRRIGVEWMAWGEGGGGGESGGAWGGRGERGGGCAGGGEGGGGGGGWGGRGVGGGGRVGEYGGDWDRRVVAGEEGRGGGGFGLGLVAGGGEGGVVGGGGGERVGVEPPFTARLWREDRRGVDERDIDGNRSPCSLKCRDGCRSEIHAFVGGWVGRMAFGLQWEFMVRVGTRDVVGG